MVANTMLPECEVKVKTSVYLILSISTNAWNRSNPLLWSYASFFDLPSKYPVKVCTQGGYTISRVGGSDSTTSHVSFSPSTSILHSQEYLSIIPPSVIAPQASYPNEPVPSTWILWFGALDGDTALPVIVPTRELGPLLQRTLLNKINGIECILSNFGLF